MALIVTCRLGVFLIPLSFHTCLSETTEKPTSTSQVYVESMSSVNLTLRLTGGFCQWNVSTSILDVLKLYSYMIQYYLQE